ncbi:MAG: hypothetical protein ACJ76N_10860 [Thermoanaerobaculia bacterium]
MFRRGKKVWRTAALAVALLWAASPSWAASRSWQVESKGWAGLWERALLWLAAPAHSSAPAGRQAREKSSAGIDPLGQTVPASTTQADSSAGIDPDGRK